MASKQILDMLDSINNYLSDLTPEEVNDVFISSSPSYRRSIKKIWDIPNEEVDFVILIDIDVGKSISSFRNKRVYFPWRLARYGNNNFLTKNFYRDVDYL